MFCVRDFVLRFVCAFCFVFCVRVFACDVRARFCLRCACADLLVLCERNFGCALCDFSSVVCVRFCFVLCVRDFALRFACAFLLCVLRVSF